MKNEIRIENFGPVKEASVDLNKSFQVFIGAQASGKSTICKVVYFCQKIRDYSLNYLMDSEQFINNHKNEYMNNYFKYLKKQFMGCFGKTTHMQKFNITYEFGQQSIRIYLKDGYVRFVFSAGLKAQIEDLVNEAAEMFVTKLHDTELKSIMDSITALGLMKKDIYTRLVGLFENSMEIIYIPAGRSLLATMSEQLQDMSVEDMDLTMQEFIRLIRVTRSRFGTKIPEIVKEYTNTIKGQVNNTALEQAYQLIKKILKADYVSESDGEKIYYDEYHWVKLMYGSSGQQEVLWILMLVFVTILEKKKTFMVVEEPEAHLFPMAQKDIVSLIALMVNSSDGKVILTTHSPYVLTSANILLYSAKVENKRNRENQIVVPKSYRVAYDTFSAFAFGADKSLSSLMDEESHMIDAGYIDGVSTITNEELERLLDMEMGG